MISTLLQNKTCVSGAAGPSSAGNASNTPFLLPSVPGDVRGLSLEESRPVLWRVLPQGPSPKGDPLLGFGGCLGTSWCGLSKPELAVCFCQDRRGCSVRGQEAELSADDAPFAGAAGPGRGGKGTEAILLLRLKQACSRNGCAVVCLPCASPKRQADSQQREAINELAECDFNRTGRGGTGEEKANPATHIVRSDPLLSLCCSQTGSCLDPATPVFILNEPLQP